MKSLLFLICTLTTLSLAAQDTIQTSKGSLVMHFVGHGSLYFEYNNKIIHIDPWRKVADYSQLPDADYVLITHDHGDHLDKEALTHILKPQTIIITTKKSKEKLGAIDNVKIVSNGDNWSLPFGKIDAVAAYNIIHVRESGKPYHAKGDGNGYVLSLDGLKIYIAGDTENIPEMKELVDIDVAFLPMNLPYTMTSEMVADATKMFNPKIIYPYHFGDTDTQVIQDLLKDSGIEVRIRDLN